jgi:hypothetical protein
MRTVVFAGAGASFAVNKDKLPMTKQFFHRLPETITANKLFSYVTHFLSDKLGSNTIDIEQVLWALKSVKDAVASFGSGKEEEAFWDVLIARGWANNLVNNLNAQDAAQKFRQLSDVTQVLEGSINAQVFAHYSYRPNKKELASNWGRVLRVLSKSEATVDLFTTNYDAVIESAAHHFDVALDRGITNDVWAYLDEARWASARTRAGRHC